MNIPHVKESWQECRQQLNTLIERWNKAFPNYRPKHEIHSSTLLNFLCWIMHSLTSAGMVRVGGLDRYSIRDRVWPILVERGLSPDELDAIIAYATHWDWKGMDHYDPTKEDWTGLRHNAEELRGQLTGEASSSQHDADQWLSDKGIVYSDNRLGMELSKDDDEVQTSLAQAAKHRVEYNLKVLAVVEEIAKALIEAQKQKKGVAC